MKNYQLGRTGPVRVFEFRVDTKNQEVARKLAASGLPLTGVQVEKRLENHLLGIANALSYRGRDALRETVPEDTGELLKHIKIDDSSAVTKPATVYLDDRDHVGRRKNVEEAAALGDYLNDPSKELRRSRSKGRYAKGQPTKNWIGDAQQEFHKNKDAVLRDLGA